MTGIERLREVVRELGRFSFCYDLYETLGNIADQIERERACDSDTAENIRLIVGRVIDDMERHVSGVDGADDSPVARWARELRHALKSDASDECGAQNPSWHDHADAADVTSGVAKVTRDPAEDVSMSAYDLLPEEDRETIAWVREHGGLDHVRAEWRSRVPYDRYERRRQRLLGHIAECERALGRRNERIAELEHERGELTRENAELRKRPTPKALDAYGVETRVGDTVWEVETGDWYVVERIYSGTTEQDFPGHTVACRRPDDIVTHMFKPSQLTHERPESKCRDCAHWQKDPTADNMGVCWFFYHEHEGQDCYAARRADIGACEEFMPRASALAGDA